MSAPLIAPLDGAEPDIDATAFVAPTAVVIGKVTLRRACSVWYGSVLRGDDDHISLGEECNVQDCCVLHADRGQPAVLGDRVSLGHGAIVHGARVEDDVLIGMRAVVLNGAVVGTGSVVGAGAVVRPGMTIPPGSLVVGVPGRVQREVGDAERDMIARTAREYVRKSDLHRHLAGGG